MNGPIESNVAAGRNDPLRESHWSGTWRAIVFFLAATSIWCLLAEMYGLCSMRMFTFWILIPSTIVLYALALWDRARGDGVLWRGVVIGSIAGFIAAVAYDVFRLPFVYSSAWGLHGIVPQMPLFKVFPRFGAMILGQPVEQPSYSLAAHVVGWIYHFSNGITFGVMYVALIGSPARRSWRWGVLLATGIEMALLLSPYGNFFGIKVTALFVAVTLVAHLIFGAVMGWYTRLSARRAFDQNLPIPA
jgi:hypothetical protein